MPYKSLFLEQVEDRVGDSSMLKFNPLLWQKPSVILSYGAAVLSVIAVLIILRWMEIALEVAAYVPLFLCAVMFSAWFGGLGPGLLAIAYRESTKRCKQRTRSGGGPKMLSRKANLI